MIGRNLTTATIAGQAMPTCEKYRQQLEPSVDFRTGEDDFSVITVQRDRRIPAADCRAIIAEIDAASMPASPEVAAQLCQLLVGSYPAREMMDPAIFVRVISATIEEYPIEIGLRAIDALTRHSKWLPTRAELVEELDRRMRRRRHAREVAEAHLNQDVGEIRRQMRLRAGAIKGGQYLSSVGVHDVRGMIKMGWLTEEEATKAGYSVG